MADRTDDRAKCGVPENKIGDKTKGIDPITKIERDFVFVKEEVIKDSDGMIIGVLKIWQ